MTIGAMHHCADRMAFRESIGFAAGQSYERRRIGEILCQRIANLRILQQGGLSKRSAQLLISEVQLLADIIEREVA